MKNKAIRVRNKVYEKLREKADAEGLTISEVVDDILIEWIGDN